MTPIHELLDRIRWDKDFGQGRFEIGYHDRHETTLQRVAFQERMTGLTPDERFANHKQGIKAASVVKRFGRRLMPELYAHLNPMPFEAAAQMEILMPAG